MKCWIVSSDRAPSDELRVQDNEEGEEQHLGLGSSVLSSMGNHRVRMFARALGA